jgi:hypothetical protein
MPLSNQSNKKSELFIDLLSKLRSLFQNEMDTIKQKWNRSLPFADYIVDRFEKARTLGFGEGSSVYDSSLILGNVKWA